MSNPPKNPLAMVTCTLCGATGSPSLMRQTLAGHACPCCVADLVAPPVRHSGPSETPVDPDDCTHPFGCEHHPEERAWGLEHLTGRRS